MAKPFIAKYDKDKDARLDYPIDWSPFLGADPIASSIWILPDDLNLENDSFSDYLTVAWISGGVLDNVYLVTNRVTTVGGRIDDRSIQITIVEK